MKNEKRVIRLLNREGDTEVATWTPGIKTEEEEAETKFDRLAQLGYLLFAISAPGKTPEQVRRFDPKAFEIVATKQFVGG